MLRSELDTGSSVTRLHPRSVRTTYFVLIPRTWIPTSSAHNQIPRDPSGRVIPRTPVRIFGFGDGRLCGKGEGRIADLRG